jgi:hypothetical protein
MNSPVDGKKRIASLILFGLTLLLSIPALADGAKKPAIVLVHAAAKAPVAGTSASH